jgi:membrane protease YdiL (CAAX protease family)
MIGILAELCISWLILWLVERKDLSVLGFTPTRTRAIQLLTGFVMSAACCAIFNAATVAFVDNSWLYNKEVTAVSLLTSSWWVLKSVLYEELIFRGALLYIAIKRLGIAKACYLSAACFGIYHWFSQNAFGNPVQMIFIFLITAVAGLMFAFSYAKTNSLYLPIGLHFGWNLVNIVVFSNGPLGVQLFTRMNEVKPQGILSILIFLFQVLSLPLLTWWWLRRINGKANPVSSNV